MTNNQTIGKAQGEKEAEDMTSDSHQTTRDLTDSEITEMAMKSGFARDLDAADDRRRLTRHGRPGSPPVAAFSGVEPPKPKRPAGGAIATQEVHDEH